TEQATIAFDPGHADVARLRAAVDAAGYELGEAPVSEAAVDREREARTREQQAQRRKFLVGAVLSLPIVIGGMPAIFPFAPAWLANPWLQLALATPVQFWVGAEFHRGFLRDLRY